MKVVTAEQMRNIDIKAAESGISTDFLMENAGREVAENIKGFIGNIVGKTVLAIAGTGNNGGDVLVTARYLHDWGADVSLYLLGNRSSDHNFSLTQERNISHVSIDHDSKLAGFSDMLAAADIVIDGILGTGKARPITGNFKAILNKLNSEKTLRKNLIIVAIDIPTGLDADTGMVEPCCPFADLTITLGLPKPGLYSFPGAAHTGKLIIADIGIPSHLYQNIKTELITSDLAMSLLPVRSLSANKGTFGRVLAIVGSENYIGAAYLACMGAARVGAGIITLAIKKNLLPILAAKLTEVTYAPLPQTRNGTISSDAAEAILNILPTYNVMLMGCGLGQHSYTKIFLEKVLFNPSQRHVVVLDADALNILSGIKNWWKRIPADAIITPHAGEMARLMGTTIDDVQKNRLNIAREASELWQKTVVLKGAYTVIAERDGRARICDAANAGLATAGTGDVLAGAIAGLAAQKLSSFDAASLGVFLHAETGAMVREEMGDTGMLASDLLPKLPFTIKSLRDNNFKQR